MVQISLPKKSEIKKGYYYKDKTGSINIRKVNIYRWDPASGENPNGRMRIDPEYIEPTHTDEKGSNWNSEAGGIEDAIGDGAHSSASLDAMIEPVSPRLDPNSYAGGGSGDNTKAMVDMAQEAKKEGRSMSVFSANGA